MDYRRIWHLGGTYFFTVNLLQRQGNTLLIDHIQDFRNAVKNVKDKYPFKIHAWVILPDHMHCIIELPNDDADYATRWRLIKSAFSRGIAKTEYLSDVRIKRQERGIWQRRYWAHLITNEKDYRAHMDYVHINPLKHGLVKNVKDWQYSTFHRYVAFGVYPEHWAGAEINVMGDD
ncbi:MAG: transposase [Methylophilus sp.]|nr:transposase [Methylophilus sp.]